MSLIEQFEGLFNIVYLLSKNQTTTKRPLLYSLWRESLVTTNAHIYMKGGEPFYSHVIEHLCCPDTASGSGQVLRSPTLCVALQLIRSLRFLRYRGDILKLLSSNVLWLIINEKERVLSYLSDLDRTSPGVTMHLWFVYVTWLKLHVSLLFPFFYN